MCHPKKYRGRPANETKNPIVINEEAVDDPHRILHGTWEHLHKMLASVCPHCPSSTLVPHKYVTEGLGSCFETELGCLLCPYRHSVSSSPTVPGTRILRVNRAQQTGALLAGLTNEQHMASLLNVDTAALSKKSWKRNVVSLTVCL